MYLTEKERECLLKPTGPGQDPEAGSCAHGNKPSGSIKDMEVLDELSDYRLFSKDSGA
jgi:hypothetical protein